jgi:hypothetical protein
MDIKTTRAFVLGAGASLHAGYPLCKDLLPKLIKWAEGNRPANCLYWIDRRELAGFGPLDDVEEIVARVEKAEKPGPLLAGIREALCGYFDSLRTKDARLYRQFAGTVVQPGDTVISLNYDVSLDRELRRAQKWEISNGYGFPVPVPGLRLSPVKLLKLHGSTNWMDSLFGGARGGEVGLVSGAGSRGTRPVVLPQEFEFLGYPGMSDPQFNGGGVDRAGSMILPSRKKQFSISTSINPSERADFWDSLWTMAAKALKRAKEITIIGYSLPEADERAKGLLFDNVMRDSLLKICCGTATSNVAEKFIRTGFPRDRILTNGLYFEDLVTAGTREKVLCGH